MGRKILIIVDMLKDFINPDGALYIGHDTSKLVENVVDLIKENPWSLIISVEDQHLEKDPEFKKFPKHCVFGTEGAELVDELADINVMPLPKVSYTVDTTWAHLLDAEEIVVCGVCTHICVHDVVASIYHNFKWRGQLPPIKVYVKCVDDFDKEMANWALLRMGSLYGVEVK